MVWNIKFKSLYKCDNERPQNPTEEDKILFIYISCFLQCKIYVLRYKIYTYRKLAYADSLRDEQQRVNSEFIHLNNQVSPLLTSKNAGLFLLKSDQLI